jgi:hypothetical protein
MSAGSSGSQDAPPNLQTRTPSFQDLSARLSLMLVPGEVQRALAHYSSISSLRLKALVRESDAGSFPLLALQRHHSVDSVNIPLQDCVGYRKSSGRAVETHEWQSLTWSGLRERDARRPRNPEQTAGWALDSIFRPTTSKP